MWFNVTMLADSRPIVSAFIVVWGLLALQQAPAFAQSPRSPFQIGIQVPITASSELEETDVGVGVRVSWHPLGPLGIEAEHNFSWRDLPDQRPITRGRVEGLYGVTVGPRLNRFRPFARFRTGFLNVQEAPAPFPCIRIFPPPLVCELGGGRTLLALDAGGGVELFASRRTFLRFDVGDRLVRYPAPVIDRERRIREKAFLSHDLRFTAGGGLTF